MKAKNKKKILVHDDSYWVKKEGNLLFKYPGGAMKVPRSVTLGYLSRTLLRSMSNYMTV